MELESHKRQKMKDGYGAVYHRIYSIRFNASFEQAKEAMQKLQQDLNHFCPQLLARFEKVQGSDRRLQKGDEFQIHITGPWNGPVRVTEATDEKFRFVTLDGHLEAGEIEFKIAKTGTNEVEFVTESLARSRDAVVDLVYDKIPIAKLAQTEMWKSFCKSFAKQALEIAGQDDRNLEEVQVLTERQNEETGLWETK